MRGSGDSRARVCERYEQKKRRCGYNLPMTFYGRDFWRQQILSLFYSRCLCRSPLSRLLLGAFLSSLPTLVELNVAAAFASFAAVNKIHGSNAVAMNHARRHCRPNCRRSVSRALHIFVYASASTRQFTAARRRAHLRLLGRKESFFVLFLAKLLSIAGSYFV